MDEEIRPDQIKEAPTYLTLELKDPNGNIVTFGILKLRQNKSKSWGYFSPLSGKLQGPEDLKLRVNTHATFIGSKDW